MAYADGAAVQARIPTTQLALGTGSQPSMSQVLEWLAADSAWLDAALAWKYVCPVTFAADIALLKPIVAALTASRCYQVMAGTDAAYLELASDLRKEALQLLGYTAQGPNAGRAQLVLSNTTLATTGEAALGQPGGTFTDPDVLGNNPRFFSIAQVL